MERVKKSEPVRVSPTESDRVAPGRTNSVDQRSNPLRENTDSGGAELMDIFLDTFYLFLTVAAA